MAEQEMPLVTVTDTWSAIRTGGRGALGLDTRELGALMIDLDLHSLSVLRAQLDNIEALMRARPQDGAARPHRNNFKFEIIFPWISAWPFTMNGGIPHFIEVAFNFTDPFQWAEKGTKPCSHA